MKVPVPSTYTNQLADMHALAIQVPVVALSASVVIIIQYATSQ
jgi:hypothetical protein